MRVLLLALVLTACGEQVKPVDLEALSFEASEDNIVDTDDINYLDEIVVEGKQSPSKAGALKHFMNACVKYAKDSLKDESVASYEVEPFDVSLLEYNVVAGVKTLARYSYKGRCKVSYLTKRN